MPKKVTSIFWTLAIILGVIQIWADPFTTSSNETVAYLDISDAYMQGRWADAINPYRSPLYPLALGLLRAILKPDAYWEFPVVKLLNFIFYLFALGCFGFFLRELTHFYENKLTQNPAKRLFHIPEWMWYAMGYCLFLWSTLVWVDLRCDKPDIFTAGCVYLASGLILKIYTGSEKFSHFILLGITLGLGYLSRSGMFLLAFI